MTATGAAARMRMRYVRLIYFERHRTDGAPGSDRTDRRKHSMLIPIHLHTTVLHKTFTSHR